MPTYEFQCKNCKCVYDELTPYDETNKYPKVRCPDCGSKRKDKLLSAVNFSFAQPEGTSRWISDSTGHDYRFKHKQKDVRAERAAAQAASKSDSPYSQITIWIPEASLVKLNK